MIEKQTDKERKWVSIIMSRRSDRKVSWEVNNNNFNNHHTYILYMSGVRATLPLMPAYYPPTSIDKVPAAPTHTQHK